MRAGYVTQSLGALPEELGFPAQRHVLGLPEATVNEEHGGSPKSSRRTDQWQIAREPTIVIVHIPGRNELASDRAIKRTR